MVSQPRPYTQPRPISPMSTRVPQSGGSVPTMHHHSSQSSNLGRPTDLSNGRPPSEISPSRTPNASRTTSPPLSSNPRQSLSVDSYPKPSTTGVSLSKPSPTPVSNGQHSSIPYQYQNGTVDYQRPEERSVSPKRRSPVPAPKPTDRSSPKRGLSPSNQGPYEPQLTKLSEQPVSSSPRVLSQPRSNNTSSPRVLSPPRMANRRTNGDSGSPSPTHSTDVRHRPLSGTSSLQGPVSHTRPSQSRLVSQATVPANMTSTLQSGRGNNKRRIEISGPVNVTALNNGPSISNPTPYVPGFTPSSSLPQNIPSILGSSPSAAGSVDDKLLFERYTSELENIGFSSNLLTLPQSLEVGSRISSTDIPREGSGVLHLPSSESESYKMYMHIVSCTCWCNMYMYLCTFTVNFC